MQFWGSLALDKTHVVGKTLFKGRFLDENTVLTFSGYVTIFDVPVNIVIRQTYVLEEEYHRHEERELVPQTTFDFGITPVLF